MKHQCVYIYIKNTFGMRDIAYQKIERGWKNKGPIAGPSIFACILSQCVSLSSSLLRCRRTWKRRCMKRPGIDTIVVFTYHPPRLFDVPSTFSSVFYSPYFFLSLWPSSLPPESSRPCISRVSIVSRNSPLGKALSRCSCISVPNILQYQCTQSARGFESFPYTFTRLARRAPELLSHRIGIIRFVKTMYRTTRGPISTTKPNDKLHPYHAFYL